jgi:hypothetical protein
VPCVLHFLYSSKLKTCADQEHIGQIWNKGNTFLFDGSPSQLMSAYHHHVCGEGLSVVYMREKNKRKKVTLYEEDDDGK